MRSVFGVPILWSPDRSGRDVSSCLSLLRGYCRGTNPYGCTTMDGFFRVVALSAAGNSPASDLAQAKAKVA